MTTAVASHRNRHAILTLIGMMLIAFNLRPALTSIGPMLRSIGDSLSLSPVGQGVLTTLPVLFLGLAAPLAPRAACRIGMEHTVLLAMLILALALGLRPYTGTVGLFVGTAIAGGCIGVAGVLLPGIVKRDFPAAASLLTGLYTAVLCIGASVAAGASEPLRIAFASVSERPWQPALAFWLCPAVIATVLWWLQLDGTQLPRQFVARTKSLYRDALAWQVALYMGLQSSMAYTVFGWLPTILQDRGLDPIGAGFALSASIMTQITTAVAAPWIASYMRDQRIMLSAMMSLTLIGLAGCIYAPLDGVWFWVVVLGLGQGGAFSIALTLLAVRARDAPTAAQLSGMAQGVGYTLAALGPLLVGVLHDLFQGWQVAGLFLGVVGAGAMAAGLGAGRDRYVGDDATGV